MDFYVLTQVAKNLTVLLAYGAHVI